MILDMCDSCANRNIMCFNCEKNIYYRQSSFSHDEYIAKEAVGQFRHSILEELEDELEYSKENFREAEVIYRKGLRYAIDKIKEGLK